MYTPVSGEVTEGNQAVVENPKLINESAFDEGIGYKDIFFFFSNLLFLLQEGKM